MPIVVFDTVVFVRALIRPGRFCGQIVFAHSERYQLILSRQLVREYLDVLTRPELTQRFSTLASLDRTRVLDILAQAPVVDIGEVPMVSRDPKDDKFLATATAAGAAYLVSEDQDLLTLGTYEGIQILTCAAFLRLLTEGGLAL
jgi:putative PIN family toxin of toxin-antitoxin system